MKITKTAADTEILRELGERLARTRLEQNITQAELAVLAGVSKRTIERLEAGVVGTQLSGFIRVCNALGLTERFDLLVPAPLPSPIEQLKLRGRQRRRASRHAPIKGAQPDPAGTWSVAEPGPADWKWGDQT
ncbi:putative transcriptional regulator with C-terminal CBS domains [Opitutaceae bacterium TAV1]|nr:putative transcriptional regulator with C-terminal CBS domains [Opitutaceae bacterium TAV1]